jgi:predicted O-methyltransferase YrrM
MRNTKAMQLTPILKFTLRSLFNSPQRLPVLISKVAARFLERGVTEEYLDWLKSTSQEIDSVCSALDSDLWAKSCEISKQIEDHGRQVALNIPAKMGGAGACALLYFITARHRPTIVVETGVALGYSSAAILSALEDNGVGHLYSSDFPYPGIPESSKYIGIVVPKNLKSRWTLLTNGDSKNLDEFLKEIERVDILHYDSDKSYRGRTNAINKLSKVLTRESIVIFDDIHENTHFRDFSERNSNLTSRVFVFRNKYIGVLGEL